MSRLDLVCPFGMGSSSQHPGYQDSGNPEPEGHLETPSPALYLCGWGSLRPRSEGTCPGVQRAWQRQAQNKEFFCTVQNGVSPDPGETTPSTSDHIRCQIPVRSWFGCFSALGPWAEIMLPRPLFLHLLNVSSSRYLPSKVTVGNKQGHA